MKSLKELCKEARTRATARVEAEAPSIPDTTRRRFAVYKSELTALAVEHHLDVLDAEIDDMAAEFAFGPPAEQKVAETPVSDEK